jgi:hypothetical protein
VKQPFNKEEEPMRLRHSPFTAALFAALAVCAGCGDSNDLVDDGKAVSEVQISPDIETLTEGSSMQFTALLAYADGTSRDVSADSSTVWNTTDAEVATVSADGLVTAVSVGVVSITADYRGVKADEDFIVTP